MQQTAWPRQVNSCVVFDAVPLFVPAVIRRSHWPHEVVQKKMNDVVEKQQAICCKQWAVFFDTDKNHGLNRGSTFQLVHSGISRAAGGQRFAARFSRCRHRCKELKLGKRSQVDRPTLAASRWILDSGRNQQFHRLSSYLSINMTWPHMA